jgi:hypothetical protein
MAKGLWCIRDAQGYQNKRDVHASLLCLRYDGYAQSAEWTHGNLTFCSSTLHVTAALSPKGRLIRRIVPGSTPKVADQEGYTLAALLLGIDALVAREQPGRCVSMLSRL